MHEMSVCEGLLQNLEEIARRENAKAITKVRLEIGCFAGIEIEALKFAYEVITKGSIANNSQLIIIEQNAKATCFECGHEFETETRICLCPKCNSAKILANGGDALKIKDLEII